MSLNYTAQVFTKMTLRSAVIRLSLLLVLIKYALCDEYISEIRDKCFKSKILIYCGNYKVMKYILNFYSDPEQLTERSYNSSAPVKFVKLKNETINFASFPNMRQITEDSEFTKIVKFLTRKTLSYLNTNGFLFNLPDESKIVGLKNDSTLNLDGSEETARGKKKKMLIIPILLLFKMFKIKVIVAVILSGILFIKKVMLLIAMVLPAMFSSLKAHCKPEPTYLPTDRYSYHDDGYYNGWSNDPYY